MGFEYATTTIVKHYIEVSQDVCRNIVETIVSIEKESENLSLIELCLSNSILFRQF